MRGAGPEAAGRAKPAGDRLIRGPGPKGKFSEADIRAFGRERAQAIADYLIAQGVDPSRLVVAEILPPLERRDSLKNAELALDRYVEMALVATP